MSESIVRLGKPRPLEPTGQQVTAPCIGGCGSTMNISLRPVVGRIWLDWECKDCGGKQ